MSATFIISQCISEKQPELLEITSRTRHMLQGVPTLLAPLIIILTSNENASCSLLSARPQASARELFAIIDLQYSKARCPLTYARGNVLLSLLHGSQGPLAAGLLPFLARTIAEPRGWTNWGQGQRYAIISIAALAFGLWVMCLTPALAVRIIGILRLALCSCTTGTLISLLGGVAS
ncbi:major facilitator superfamily transporter [Fusarium beomiforme]|uniref:Major facilitator superfamily transporter n=1 Tax=Fusarium beomiforme TaxID=44412 RepID=A0A9P5DVY9_9HYPO|nr:major facilitator superfamily transporter [Fusarium beomiforme]